MLFRAPSLGVARDYFARLMLPPFTASKTPGVLLGWLIAFAVLQRPLAATLKENWFVKCALWKQWLLVLAALYLVLAYAGARVDFIYFTF